MPPPDAGTIPEATRPIDLASATILLVDDNLQNLELMQAYLDDLPCIIRTATNGEEAMASIDAHPPDVILLDVMMPRMSGFEVCQKIKSNPRTRDIVVIMVTALHEVGDFERALDVGTDDFITKPVNKIELLTRVRSLAELRIVKDRYQQLLDLKRTIELDERVGGTGIDKLTGESPLDPTREDRLDDNSDG